MNRKGCAIAIVIACGVILVLGIGTLEVLRREYQDPMTLNIIVPAKYSGYVYFGESKRNGASRDSSGNLTIQVNDDGIGLVESQEEFSHWHVIKVRDRAGQLYTNVYSYEDALYTKASWMSYEGGGVTILGGKYDITYSQMFVGKREKLIAKAKVGKLNDPSDTPPPALLRIADYIKH